MITHATQSDINGESFESIAPKAAQLKAHIAYYYFHQTHQIDGVNRVIYYPNHQDAINIYRHADVQWDEYGRTITANSSEFNSCVYTSNQQQARMVTMLGAHFKIGIVFNPLGFNHFIDVPFNQLIHGVVTPFDYFGAGFLKLTDQLYAAKQLTAKRQLLDEFFVSRFTGFTDQPFKKLIEHMLHHDPNIDVAAMASHLKVSGKTVLRRFKQHLGHAPREFKAVIKFRQALLQYQQQSKTSKPSLTEIGIQSAYYDQSDFIKQYKSLVGLTPKQLFKRIQSLGSNNTFWTHLTTES